MMLLKVKSYLFTLFCLIISLPFLIVTLFSIQHPTGFITLDESIKEGAIVTYVLQEHETKQFVLSLEHGAVVGEGGIVTQDGKILTDTETYKRDQQRLLQEGRDISKEPAMFFDETLAVISSPGQQCYYHWLLQVIPRLKILTDAKVAYDKIYVHANNVTHHWQKDALYAAMDHLSISHDKLLFVADDTIVEAKKLLVPSVAWIPSKLDFWRSSLHWYKVFFNDTYVQHAENSPKRIFISRAQAAYRRISNETDLMQFLASKGFVSYCLENLSVKEQATLFNNAEIIVGPHGSGWSNLIFCKPETHIIEIDHGLQGTEQRSSFKGMAHYMECVYYPFYTDMLEQTDSPENILDPVNHDMTVDIPAFRELFQQFD